MARSFVGASSQYLSNASAVLTTTPITMACWFYSLDITAEYTLISIGVSGSGDNRHGLFISGNVAGDPVRAITRTTATGIAASTTGYSANVWQHACAVFVSATVRRAYVNGGSEGTNATSRAPTGMNNTLIGAVQGVALSTFMSGRIAEAGIWNVQLNASEIAALAKGVSPLRIRPNALKAYWPLFGVGSPEPDYSNGGFHMTLNAAPVQAAHAPVMPPFFREDWYGEFTTAAAAAGKPWNYYAQQ